MQITSFYIFIIFPAGNSAWTPALRNSKNLLESSQSQHLRWIYTDEQDINFKMLSPSPSSKRLEGLLHKQQMWRENQRINVYKELQSTIKGSEKVHVTCSNVVTSGWFTFHYFMGLMRTEKKIETIKLFGKQLCAYLFMLLIHRIKFSRQCTIQGVMRPW